MKYFLITYGCQMNEADSERIAASLEKKGYKLASEMKNADLIVVNMCSVRQAAVDRIFGLAQKLSKPKAQNPRLKTILTGCILNSDKIKFRKIFDKIWDKKDLLNNKILKQCRRLICGTVSYIPISNGCDNACAYCVVPFTRGKLVCRDHKAILKEVKNAARKGSKEIWLLGQNVNDYTSPADASINFAKLLKAAASIPGDFKIRFMSPNPKNFTEELIDAMADCQKVAKFLNLPVQSGDNKILKKMNRPYTAEHYEKLVKKIRKRVPDINLTTDAIVGFPGETKLQFQSTVKLFKKIKFNLAYISKYSARPGTAAFLLKDNISLEKKKRRWKILNKLVNEPR